MIISDELIFYKTYNNNFGVGIFFSNSFPINFFLYLSSLISGEIKHFTISDKSKKKYIRIMISNSLSEYIRKFPKGYIQKFSEGYIEKYSKGYNLYLGNEGINTIRNALTNFYTNWYWRDKHRIHEMEIYNSSGSYFELIFHYIYDEIKYLDNIVFLSNEVYFEEFKNDISIIFDFENRFPKEFYMNFQVLRLYNKKELEILNSFKEVKYKVKITNKDSYYKKYREIYYLYLSLEDIDKVLINLELWYLGKLENDYLLLELNNYDKKLNLEFWMNSKVILNLQK